MRLVPAEDDFTAIVGRVDFYRKHIPWVNRGLVLRAGLNASEFRIDAPGLPEQAEWMLDLKRGLRLFSLMREFFWELRAYGQVVVLWKTLPANQAVAAEGRKPLSIECANPLVYQPRFNPKSGMEPRIVVVPANDSELVKLVGEAQSGDDATKTRAQARLNAYPKPFRDAVGGGVASLTKAEIPVEDLEKYGYHFEYAALDRRHWENWAFPGMYSIFPYLEMLMLADDADINVLHHYKAGILLVRLGPPEPKAGDEGLIAGEPELKAIDKKLAEMVKMRLPAWAARGDLRIDWIVPPDHLMNPQKVASAKEKTLDWLGFPKIAWPGQDVGGAFATMQSALKFLQVESNDERAIAKELFEAMFYGWSKASNKFKAAVWPRARFDPNALMEPRTLLELARLYQSLGGADEQTIAEMFGYDSEVWLARRIETAAWKKKYKTDFSPEFVPARSSPAAGQPTGRPVTTNQPTPERDADQQPRPSLEVAVEVAAREYGINPDEFRAAVEAEVVLAE
jgi:hypothetical protein